MSGVLVCPRCGAAPEIPGARFCGRCGAPLPAERQRYHGPPRLKLGGGLALSCPECGEPMRFGFRHVCRKCGAELCMVPMLFHPSHRRVYVKGLRAAGAMLLYDLVWYPIALGALVLFGLALKQCAAGATAPHRRHAAVTLDRKAGADLASITVGSAAR